MSTPAVNIDGLSAADRQAVAMALNLDDPQKKHLYEEYLVNKWENWIGEPAEKKGFPKITSDRSAKVMAMLLENQMRFQRDRRVPVVDGHVYLTQDTQTSDEALPTKFSLPIVRRAYALMLQMDWSVTQPLPGPTGYVFFLDFLRESDTTNILSVEYNWALTGELAVPPKGKLQLQRVLLQAVKQLMGTTFTLEALEDARAQLGLDIEQELIAAFTGEFVRNIFGRILKDVWNAAQNNTATGSSMPAPWSAGNPSYTFPAQSAYSTLADWKNAVYNTLVEMAASFQRRNRIAPDGILAGYGAAATLQMANTATQATMPDQTNTAGLGITDYGRYVERFHIWGTDFLPDNAVIMYKRNPDTLHAAHVYAPYVPLQVMPAIYGDYDASTGNYQNKDAWTRNIRERSAEIVTKPYGFLPGTASVVGAQA